MSIISRLVSAASVLKGGSPQTPAYWVKKLFGHENTIVGLSVNEDSALKYSAVWSAVNIISGAIGSLPLVTYRRLAQGKDKDYRHKVSNLVKRPNEYMDGLTFRRVLQAHALLWGNGYAEIERNGAGRPIKLWPLLPNLVEPKIIDEKLVYEVQTSSGTTTILPYDNVIHIKGLGYDGLRGYSVISQFAAENIGLGLAAERNAAVFFGNDSTPAGILTTDMVLGKDAKDQIEKQWADKQKGLDKKYRVAILHSGLKYEKIAIPAKDAQLLESRQYSVSDISRWFTIPPHMLGDLERATFSNIEEQSLDFAKWTLSSWVRTWELELSYKLFATYEQNTYYLEFLMDALLRGNNETRSKSYQVALGGNNNPGWMTINEVREKENLPAIADGDKIFKPSYGNNAENLVSTTWNRIITKEVKAVQKAIKKPQEFIAWAEDFYEKHRAYMISVLEPVLEALNKKDCLITVYDHCLSQLNKLKAAHKDNQVIDEISSWQQIPIKMTEIIIEGQNEI